MGLRGRPFLIAVTVFLSWLPYLFGAFLTPLSSRYFWLIYNPDDPNVHLMWARQAMEGAWRFQDLFTTEPHPGLFVNLFSLLLGRFCLLTGVPLHLGYQVFRTLIAIAFLGVAFWFGDLFIRTERGRKAYALSVCFSSGFGWFPVLWWWLTKTRPPLYFVDVSPELMMPEANSFLSLCVAPLAALGVTLVMGMLGNAFLAGEGKKAAVKAGTLAALSGVLVANIHTYALPPALLALALSLLLSASVRRKISWKQVGFLIAVSAPCVLVLVVQGLVFARDPVFLQKAMTPTLTPPWPVLLGSYGLVGVMGIGGFIFALRDLWRRKTDQALPIAWLIALLVAIHFPVSFQRKMIEGLHVVLCLFCALAWERITQRSSQSFHRKALAVFISLTIPSQIAFFVLNGYWLIHNNLIYDTRFRPPYSRQLMPPYFLPETHLLLFRWVEENSRKDEAILCHPMLGNYLPVLTGRKVFLGHWAETLNFSRKLSLAVSIWRGEMSPGKAREFFRRHRLRYALETALERSAVNGPTALPLYGVPVYRVGDDKIFRLHW